MKERSTQVLAMMVLSFASIPLTCLGHTVSFQGVGDLPGETFYSSAEGISSDGVVVVGSSMGAKGYEAFRWTESGGMVGLCDLPSWETSIAYATSADGSVVVGAATLGDPIGIRQAFRWTESTGMVGLGGCWAYDVSADGSVVVGWTDYSGPFRAFRWTEADGMQELGDLPGGEIESGANAISPDGAVVVGFSDSASGFEAFRWENSVMAGLGDLPGGNFHSSAIGVSADGSVVVGWGWSTQGDEAFRWENGVMTGLGDLPGGRFRSGAEAVSANGSVVVGFGTTSTEGEIEAFIWDQTNGMRNLKDVLGKGYGLDLSGWTLQNATGISADGLTIVGYGINPDGLAEGWIATIPEPGTLLLFGLGTIFLRRRR